ncbi:N/A [soil metagenome]
MNDRLLELVWQHDELAELDPAARRLALRSLLGGVVDEGDVSRCVAELADAIDGYGPLSAVMRDELVTDVLVNGPAEVWVERAGALQRSPHGFADATELRAFLDRLMGRCGERLDASTPIATARLADGSRLHAVLPPIAPRGPLLSIRRAPRSPLRLEDLVNRGFLGRDEAAELVELVERRRSLAISGGTGTGKTTLLNALLAHVPPSQRVVTIEETPELTPACAHRVALVARGANAEGTGAVDLETLVRAGLRMRPDRIIVGEVRGGEALAALSAMSTGHEGSMVTVHARSADDALDRLVTLSLQAASGASERSLERQVRRAVHAVVHLAREESGKRRVATLARMP